MPDFVQTEIKAIDDQLRILIDEASRLEAARAALTGGPRRRGRPVANGAARTSVRSASRRTRRAAAPRPGRGGNTRANQTLELVRERPGITILGIAKAMKIESNYLYRVLPRLASNGQVKRDGQAAVGRGCRWGGWLRPLGGTVRALLPQDRASLARSRDDIPQGGPNGCGPLGGRC